MVGIVTGRDLRFESRYDVPVSEIMTPREKLITVPDGTTLAEAKALLNKHKLERLLVINERLGAQGPDHRQGHHQADQLSQRGARRAAGGCAWARRWAWARAPRSASRRWCGPASTPSWSTPRTATAPA